MLKQTLIMKYLYGKIALLWSDNKIGNASAGLSPMYINMCAGDVHMELWSLHKEYFYKKVPRNHKIALHVLLSNKK